MRGPKRPCDPDCGADPGPSGYVERSLWADAACSAEDAPVRLYEEWARVHATCRVYFWGSDATATAPSRDVPNRYCSGCEAAQGGARP